MLIRAGLSEGGRGRSFFELKFASKIVFVFLSFLVSKRWLLGGIFGGQISPKAILNEVSCSKNDFWKSVFFPSGNAKNEEHNALKSTKNGSKSFLERYFLHLVFCLRFWYVLGTILVTFWLPKWSQVGSKIEQKNNPKK